ncbi:helix-turn-helix transcriptional regulator [Plantactinospora sp. B5E13]|uniref:helix-turn-helix transcriptional regulator n=1 Tax=Plantactinospora sp. B5E13 TaxID=3153758 RepID=UPI00325CABB4
MTGRSTGVLAVGTAVPLLVRWGLSADADLVYRCLVSFGPRNAGAVAASLGLPVRRVRAALEELDDADLVGVNGPATAYGAGAVSWRAVPVDAAVPTLRRRAFRRAAAPGGAGSVPMPAHVAFAPSSGPPFVAPSGQAFPARHLPDRAATRRRIAELVAVERAEHLAMNPEEIFSTEALAIAAPMDLALLRRRIRLRSLGRAPADGDRSSRHATEFARLGGEYREAVRLPHKLMIFDRRVALVAVDPGGLDRGTWEVVEPAAVESLLSLFARHWTDATDPRRNGVPEVVLTPRERAVVGLLAEGHTDSSAAKQLGISTRSVTYTLRALMDRLGVENRFQLGLALGALNAATPSKATTPSRTSECEPTEGDER